MTRKFKSEEALIGAQSPKLLSAEPLKVFSEPSILSRIGLPQKSESLNTSIASKFVSHSGLALVPVIASSSATLKYAIDLVRPAGWISKVGWGPQPLNFSLDPLVQKNLTLRGSFSHNWPIWEAVIAMLADGRLDVDPIIGGVWPLDQWRDAFDAMHEGRVVKAVLKP